MKTITKKTDSDIIKDIKVILELWLWDLFYEKLLNYKEKNEEEIISDLKEILKDKYDEKISEIFLKTLNIILSDKSNLENNTEKYLNKLVIFKSQKLIKWLAEKLEEKDKEIERLKKL